MHGEFKICVAVVVLCTSRKNTRQNGSLYRNFGYVFRYWFCRATKVGSSIDIFLSSLIFCVVQKMSRKVICQNSKKWVSSGSHFGNVGVIRNCPILSRSEVSISSDTNRTEIESDTCR